MSPYRLCTGISYTVKHRFITHVNNAKLWTKCLDLQVSFSLPQEKADKLQCSP